MCLATLRPDGFAGYETEEKAAQIITKALSYAGGAITVNADISNGGFLRVKVLSENGKEIAVSKVLSANLINSELQFDKKIEAGSVKLVFDFVKAKLYSFDIL
ncbi:MAG: hypothetical protein ABS28_02825 [Cryomorphaceae bacterium BACL22 MAG-120619-bin32]|jgi:hypothetical protein|nr:MAG: hypothetical protein ABS28_02825 [Cryomorphaceae bacterium BACL22 MAG-120619-bin32]